MIWQTVIGLEVHAQLKTQSKLFSPASTVFGAQANTHASFIDAGLPGTLPVLNQEALRLGVLFGIAIDAQINSLSFFERKNYIYPDLPKSYQITQRQRPLLSGGHLDIESTPGISKKITIHHAHLEEDAGKLIHAFHGHHSGVDLNRAGNPLLEIVTDPCLFSAHEAILYLRKLHQLLVFLDICNGSMQEGSFRCDVNLSIKAPHEKILGTRVEIKNLNSFHFIEKAIDFEIQRQKSCIESGQLIQQETRLYCETRHETIVMRSKEDLNDYRYLPDPDLMPIFISQEYLNEIRSLCPPLPDAIKERLIESDELEADDLDFLLSSPKWLHVYDEIKNQSSVSPKSIVNWLKGPMRAALNQNPSRQIPKEILITLLNHLETQQISFHAAKRIFNLSLESDQDIDFLIQKEIENHSNWSEEAIQNIISKTIAAQTELWADLKAGKDKLLAFFVGQIMKELKGQADPAAVSRLIQKNLNQS